MSLRSLIAVTGVVLVISTPVPTVHAQDNRVVENARSRAATFALVVDGKEIGVFTQLLSEADLTTSTNRTITLAGGRTEGMEIAAWHELVILGDVAARKNASIVLYDPKGTPVSTYHFTNAWPTKVSLDGGGRGGITTAKLMLIYETVRISVD